MLHEDILAVFLLFFMGSQQLFLVCRLSTGWLQSTLQAELNPVHEQGALNLQLAEASRPKPKYDEGQGVDAVIRRLESRVPEPALRSPE